MSWCYNHDRQNRKKIDQNKHVGYKNFNVENLSDDKGKNHGRQPANLHYMRECLHNAGILQMQLISCGSLKDV
jgi:hypothetical protein